jgi:parallel beta-helix repeat protein
MNTVKLPRPAAGISLVYLLLLACEPTQTSAPGSLSGPPSASPDEVYPAGVYPCVPPAGARIIDVDAAGGPEAALARTDGAVAALVRFQPHLYTIAKTLVVKSETYLCGVAGKTILQLAPNSAEPTLLTSVSNVTNVTINGITFDGNKARQTTGGAGVVLLFSHFAHIVNVRVQNFRGVTPGGTALYLRGAESPLIEHSFFVDNGVPGETGCDGLALSGFGARVIGNFAFGNTDTGFATQNSRDMLFESNVAKRNGNGLAAGSPAHHLTYRKNRSTENRHGFLYCPCNGAPGGHEVLVEDNDFERNTDAGIYVLGEPRAMPTGFTIVDNRVLQSRGASKLIEGANGVLLRYASGVTLRGNVIEQSDNHGVLVIGSKQVQILANTIRSNSQARACASDGVYVIDDLATHVSSDQVTIAGNVVGDNVRVPTQGRGIVVTTTGSVTVGTNDVHGNCQ